MTVMVSEEIKLWAYGMPCGQNASKGKFKASRAYGNKNLRAPFLFPDKP